MKIYILIISLFSTVAFGKTTTILNKKKATTENAIKVIQENGKTIYQYCERDELTGAKDDVFLVKYNCEAIGKIDGYTKLDLKQIDKQLKKQHRNEYIMDAAAVATFLLSYKIAAKRFAARQTYRWDNGQFTSMFYSATSFNGDISNWDTGKVTDMSFMFNGGTSFNKNLNNWDVSNVTNMLNMFFNADAFNQNLSNWDTANVTSMANMFLQASNFNSDIGNWDV